MRKSFKVIICILLLAITMAFCLAGCVPFTIDGYLTKAMKNGNVTITYEWDLIGSKSKDVFMYAGEDFGRIASNYELYAKLQGDIYKIYWKENNVWYKHRDMEYDEFKSAIGEHGDEFNPNNSEKLPIKKEMVDIAVRAFDLARENFKGAYTREDKVYTLNEEYYNQVFNRTSGSFALDITQKGSEVIMNIKNGSYKVKVTLSDLGSTKVKFTKDMTSTQNQKDLL